MVLYSSVTELATRLFPMNVCAARCSHPAIESILLGQLKFYVTFILTITITITVTIIITITVTRSVTGLSLVVIVPSERLSL